MRKTLKYRIHRCIIRLLSPRIQDLSFKPLICEKSQNKEKIQKISISFVISNFNTLFMRTNDIASSDLFPFLISYKLITGNDDRLTERVKLSNFYCKFQKKLKNYSPSSMNCFNESLPHTNRCHNLKCFFNWCTNNIYIH